MSIYVLIVLALVTSALLGSLLERLWKRREQREVEQRWRDRERLLDRRRPAASRRDVLRRRVRPRGRARGRRPSARG
ncbi:MAG TPA: hypothetical protein VJX71_19190 [Methylomirabilota bacterium]|nr:hypothetical protein [Methylomirabilota bacterium]